MQVVCSRTSLEEGRALYGLTDSELFWDKASDTKMLLAWSRTCVVCAFRGTASLNNAMSDLQACPCTWTRVSGAVLAVCKLRWTVGVDSMHELPQLWPEGLHVCMPYEVSCA